jgi:hypothetical protein
MCIICRNFDDDMCNKCNDIKALESEIKKNQSNKILIKILEKNITLLEHKCDVSTSEILYCTDCPNLTEIKDLPSRITNIVIGYCPNLKRIISTTLVYCNDCPKLIEIDTPNINDLIIDYCSNILELPIVDHIYECRCDSYYLTVENRLKVAIVKKAIRNMERIIRYTKYFKSREFIEWSHDPNRLGGRLIKSQLANFVKSIC